MPYWSSFIVCFWYFSLLRNMLASSPFPAWRYDVIFQFLFFYLFYTEFYFFLVNRATVHYSDQCTDACLRMLLLIHDGPGYFNVWQSITWVASQDHPIATLYKVLLSLRHLITSLTIRPSLQLHEDFANTDPVYALFPRLYYVGVH